MIKTNPSVGVWRGGGTPPPALFAVDGADFNGTNQSMARGANLTGIADSASGICSAWFRLDGGDAANQMLLGGVNAANTNGIIVYRGTDNLIRVQSPNASFYMESAGTYVAGTGWHHILAAWNGATTTVHLYIDDTNVAAVGSGCINTATTYTTVVDWFVARGDATLYANHFLNGALADLYFAPGQFLDMSVEANRRKFIDGNKPVSLGATGSTPTGTAPRILQHLDDAEAVANFATNRGTGGNFTITNGPLATASTSPSD